MITLEQVQLLDEKIENCLARIAELTSENDALRRKCVELTNALSAKTESLSIFQQDQSRIEEGILHALERLNAVENSILNATGIGVKSDVPNQAISNPSVQNSGISSHSAVNNTASQNIRPLSQPVQKPQVQNPINSRPVQQVSVPDVQSSQVAQSVKPAEVQNVAPVEMLPDEITISVPPVDKNVSEARKGDVYGDLFTDNASSNGQNPAVYDIF